MLRGRRVSGRMAGAAVLVLSVVAAYTLYSYGGVEENIAFVLSFMVYPAIVVLFETDFVKRLFSAKIWGELSAISYDVYLWHASLIVAIYIFMKCTGIYFDFSQRKNMFVFLLLAEVVGAVSHYCIEKPLNRAVERQAVKYGILQEKNI